jgi:hypothetical protein
MVTIAEPVRPAPVPVIVVVPRVAGAVHATPGAVPFEAVTEADGESVPPNDELHAIETPANGTKSPDGSRMSPVTPRVWPGLRQAPLLTRTPMRLGTRPSTVSVACAPNPRSRAVRVCGPAPRIQSERLALPFAPVTLVVLLRVPALALHCTVTPGTAFTNASQTPA